MMQNPMFMQMAMQMMQNPQFMQQIVSANPLLRNMPPEALQQTMQLMNNPQAMEQMMRMMAGGGAAGGGGVARPLGGNTAPANAAFPFGNFAPPHVANPQEAYASQLQQLRAMGFPNEQANIAALQQSQGNIEFAIERLLGA
jgi:ubiquilin